MKMHNAAVIIGQVDDVVGGLCRMVQRLARAGGDAIALMFLIVGATVAAKASTDTVAVKEPTPAIAFAGRIVGNSERFRLILDFDRSVDQQAYVLDQPRRLIVDLSETVFSLEDKIRQSPTSLVKDIRFGTIAPGKSRVVIDLSGPVKIDKTSFKEVADENRYRFIVDVLVSTEADFKTAAVLGAKTRKGGKVAYKGDRVRREEKQEKTLVLVIDPGHGGIDGGAVGKNRVFEKDITLRFAKTLQKKMQGVPNFKVLLTRDRDVFVSLQDRIDFAHRNHADLMVSVHADSLRQKNIRGATVYTLSDKGSDELSRQLAEKENRADLIAGLELPKVDKTVTDILIDLTRRETEIFSTRFAKMLITQMKSDIKMIRNPHRSADFFVLRAADIPSVLLELGYLSNKSDQKLMQSDAWHEKAADRLREATLSFFKPRMVAQ